MTPKINWKPNHAEIRQFGWVLWAGFALIGGFIWWKGYHDTAKIIWSVTTAISLLALLLPSAAKPFYWVWMGFGFVMGSIMSRVVMGIIFFGLITPIALVFRLKKRDELRLRQEPSRDTYWNEHPVISKENRLRMF